MGKSFLSDEELNSLLKGSETDEDNLSKKEISLMTDLLESLILEVNKNDINLNIKVLGIEQELDDEDLSFNSESKIISIIIDEITFYLVISEGHGYDLSSDSNLISAIQKCISSILNGTYKFSSLKGEVKSIEIINEIPTADNVSKLNFEDEGVVHNLFIDKKVLKLLVDEYFDSQKSHETDGLEEFEEYEEFESNKDNKETIPIRKAIFDSLTPGLIDSNEDNLKLIIDVPLDVTVILGKAKKSIQEVLELGSGSLIELDKLAEEPVEVLVNGKKIALGEVVVIDENFGVRITEIVSGVEKIKSLN